MNDKNGMTISEGDLVTVPDPLPNALYNHSFVGRVLSTNEDLGTVVVIDQDDDAYELDAYTLELA